MAKITELPALDTATIDGAETALIVKDGVTYRAPFSALGLEAADIRRIGSVNLFNPEADIISGYEYNSTGGQAFNPAYKVSKRYTGLVPGESITISGLGALKSIPFWRHLTFWNDAAFVSNVPLPDTQTPTDHITAVIPAGANGMTINFHDVPPPVDTLQIELADRPSEYQPFYGLKYGLPAAALDSALFETSVKNLYDGKIQARRALADTTIGTTTADADVMSGFIPVQNGRTYTISGLDPDLVSTPANRRVLGYSSDQIGNGAVHFVKKIGAWGSDGTLTFTVDSLNVKFIIIQLARSGQGGTLEGARNLFLQVEESDQPTFFEPHRLLRGALSLVRSGVAESKAHADIIGKRSQYSRIRMDILGSAASPIALASVIRKPGPFGAYYKVASEAGQDAVGNNLFASVKGIEPGARSVYAEVANLVDGFAAKGGITVERFTVPSGQLDNGSGPLSNYSATSPLDTYVHPAVAYDDVGVAGFKYWMIASVYPGYTTGGAEWEDEDLFVSNDAASWQRVRSLYETDKVYTTAELRLPPHDFAADGRLHGFLPVPAAGDTIEMSTPADNGAPALDRADVTLINYPWKHDPSIIIDGGYVYIYLSYHLSSAARPGGTSRFLVLVRTADGINWESVRSDGSTLKLDSPAAARQLFTKDGSGRFNYLNYAYNRARSNPEILKYGANDFELVYEENFRGRYKGTSPWGIDFSTIHPMQDMASGNHPGLLLLGSTLYLYNQNGVHVSADRGATFNSLNHYPSWLGGASGITYKHALCVGAGGKVHLVQARRVDLSAASRPAENGFTATNPYNFLTICTFPSTADFIAKSTDGLVEGHVDIQIDQVNYEAGTRRSIFTPYITNSVASPLANSPHQRRKIADLTIVEGDVLHIYASLTARNGASVSLNSIEIL